MVKPTLSTRRVIPESRLKLISLYNELLDKYGVDIPRLRRYVIDRVFDYTLENTKKGRHLSRSEIEEAVKNTLKDVLEFYTDRIKWKRQVGCETYHSFYPTIYGCFEDVQVKPEGDKYVVEVRSSYGEPVSFISMPKLSSDEVERLKEIVKGFQL